MTQTDSGQRDRACCSEFASIGTSPTPGHCLCRAQAHGGLTVKNYFKFLGPLQVDARHNFALGRQQFCKSRRYSASPVGFPVMGYQIWNLSFLGSHPRIPFWDISQGTRNIRSCWAARRLLATNQNHRISSKVMNQVHVPHKLFRLFAFSRVSDSHCQSEQAISNDRQPDCPFRQFSVLINILTVQPNSFYSCSQVNNFPSINLYCRCSESLSISTTAVHPLFPLPSSPAFPPLRLLYWLSVQTFLQQRKAITCQQSVVIRWYVSPILLCSILKSLPLNMKDQFLMLQKLILPVQGTADCEEHGIFVLLFSAGVLKCLWQINTISSQSIWVEPLQCQCLVLYCKVSAIISVEVDHKEDDGSPSGSKQQAPSSNSGLQISHSSLTQAKDYPDVWMWIQSCILEAILKEQETSGRRFS